jgi:hypothetical protein
MKTQVTNSDTTIDTSAEKIMLNHKFNPPFLSPHMSQYINYGFKLPPINNYHSFFNPSSINSIPGESASYKECMLINPKGVVADDFMFVFTIKEYSYMGVMKIDFSESTKAMVSMAINQYIDNLVSSNQILMPSIILNNIQEFVHDVIQYEHLDYFSKHNLMMSLACIDITNQQIIYSGSHKDVFLTLNDFVYDLSSNNQLLDMNKGMQHLCFKDYSVSVSENKLAEDQKKDEDLPMYLYFSNLSDLRNYIN